LQSIWTSFQFLRTKKEISLQWHKNVLIIFLMLFGFDLTMFITIHVFLLTEQPTIENLMCFLILCLHVHSYHVHVSLFGKRNILISQRYQLYPASAITHCPSDNMDAHS
jgi:hypothetical protein